jgi:hypothetical protein
MIVLKLLNITLVFFLLKFLNKFKPSLFNLLLIFPYVQKEFISSIHIDLFAACLFLISIYYIEIYKINSKIVLMGLILSFWSKFLSILAFPFILLMTPEKKVLKSILVLIFAVPISLLLFFFLFIKDFDLLLGVKAFSENWFWHPGFFTFLTDVLEVEHQKARKLTGVIFIIFYSLLLLIYKMINFEKRREKLSSMMLLVFSGLIFFSPVFNPWYAIWFLPFAIIRNNIWGVLYASFSFLSYTAYGHSTYLHYTQFLNHILFLPLIYTEFFLIKKCKTRS